MTPTKENPLVAEVMAITENFACDDDHPQFFEIRADLKSRLTALLGDAEPFPHASIVMKIMEAAWTGDTAMAARYANLMADKMGSSGQYVREKVEVLEGKRPAVWVTLQGGLSNDQLRAAWDRKLPGVEPKDRELNAFAIGVEVGAALLGEPVAWQPIETAPESSQELYLLVWSESCGIQIAYENRKNEWLDQTGAPVYCPPTHYKPLPPPPIALAAPLPKGPDEGGGK